MVKELQYKTSYSKDKFSIYSDERLIGKLFKFSWLWKGILELNGKTFHLKRTGLLRRQVVVLDQNLNKVVITARAPWGLFLFRQHAEATFSDSRKFYWQQRGIVNPSWEWRDHSGLVMKATEHNGLFRIDGAINFEQEEPQGELLGVLGIYLRSLAFNGIFGFFVSLVILLAVVARLLLA